MYCLICFDLFLLSSYFETWRRISSYFLLNLLFDGENKTEDVEVCNVVLEGEKQIRWDDFAKEFFVIELLVVNKFEFVSSKDILILLK